MVRHFSFLILLFYSICQSLYNFSHILSHPSTLIIFCPSSSLLPYFSMLFLPFLLSFYDPSSFFPSSFSLLYLRTTTTPLTHPHPLLTWKLFFHSILNSHPFGPEIVLVKACHGCEYSHGSTDCRKREKGSLRHIGMNRKEEGREGRASVGQMEKKKGNNDPSGWEREREEMRTCLFVKV